MSERQCGISCADLFFPWLFSLFFFLIQATSFITLFTRSYPWIWNMPLKMGESNVLYLTPKKKNKHTHTAVFMVYFSFSSLLEFCLIKVLFWRTAATFVPPPFTQKWKQVQSRSWRTLEKHILFTTLSHNEMSCIAWEPGHTSSEYQGIYSCLKQQDCQTPPVAA